MNRANARSEIKKQGCLMIGSDNIPEYWHIKKILKRVKKARKRLC